MMGKRATFSDRIIDAVIVALLCLLLVGALYPLYFVLIASISSPSAIYYGEVWLLPKGLSFGGYERIFQSASIWRGYSNTLLYTLLGTFINLATTFPAAYAITRPKLKGRNVMMFIILFTMFFSGGLVPTYILVTNLGIRNSMWAMVFPEAIIVWYFIIARTFFQNSIPPEILDAAAIDGASEAMIFFRIVLPLSNALLSIMLLYYAVYHWNTYFNALIYLDQGKLYPLQLVLRSILVQNQISSDMVTDLTSIAEQQKLADLIKYGTIVVSSLPLLMIYPFMQKYFMKGVMIGAVKG